MASDNNNTRQPTQFEQVLEQELIYFKNRKDTSRAKDNDEENKPIRQANCDSKYAADIVRKASQERLTGLAFSGGGIRSATFNLGVLQALAKLKILDQFDYLSTVSGGGYIGSWIVAWIRRKDIDLDEAKKHSGSKGDSPCDKKDTGLEAVSCELAASIGDDESNQPKAAMQPDPPPIWHLREYSNYLSPKRGLWSTDTWTLGVTYLRNLVLTFSLLLTTLITVVLLTRAGVSFYFQMAHPDPVSGSFQSAYLWAPALFCLFLFSSSLLGGIELRLCQTSSHKNSWRSYFAISTTWLAAATGALWLYHAVSLPSNYFTLMLSTLYPSDFSLALISLIPSHWSGLYVSSIPIILSTFSGWLLGRVIGKIKAKGQSNNTRQNSGLTIFWGLFIGPLLSLVILIFLSHLLGIWITTWLASDLEPWAQPLWHIVVWGTPLFVLLFSLVTAVFVGLAGSALSELEREWLARFFAVLTKWTVLSTGLIAMVVYSYCSVVWLAENVGESFNLGVGTLWAVISAAGAFLARNAMANQSALQGWLKRIILAIAPFVFIFGMLVLTTWATESIVDWLAVNLELVRAPNEDPPGFWFLMAELNIGYVLIMAFLAAGLTGLWSWRVGVNRFSLHSLYADRLIRAYLGASNLKRNANPFTGFDDNDNDVHMRDLANDKMQYTGPYPIINTAINLVSSQRLAWQKRKAASFTFTPQYCGYEYCGEREYNKNSTQDEQTGRIGGFVESRSYAGDPDKGISLGKAMTISGAAASPNMGYHSTPALTFLMTTFNMRLGWWLPNTAKTNNKLLANRGPGWGLLYLLYELLGLTNVKRNYVYLSDGGHFENLGIYELVRRRCRIIVASDAEADPKMTFSGLGNAIEKCRTDLGVPIDIDVSQIRPEPSNGLSSWHCAVGCIRYSAVDPGQPDGTLVYIKASLTGDEPQDIATYACDHNSFPHETTADQWFDETQFESYRTLGEHIVQKVLGISVSIASDAAKIKKENTLRCIERVILELRKQWYAGTDLHKHVPVNHDAELAAIVDTLRMDTNLAFLDCQLYPNLEKLADTHFHRSLFPRHIYSIPRNYEQFRAGFYFCKRLIQFMQQVYYDTQLDMEFGAPRNRGWMNLFRRWSLSRMLRFTWTLTAGTYGARFQSFCEYHLSLDSGEPAFSDQPLEIKATLHSHEEPPRLEFNLPLESSKISASFNWEDAEKLFGFHYYETRVIREFIHAYVLHEDFKDYTWPMIFQVFPIKVFTDDVVEEQADKDMELNAGMLIAGPVFIEKNEGQRELIDAILYFRIRPSMRNMDLARKAFMECRQHPILKNYLVQLIDELPPISDGNMAAWERRAYNDVHFMDRNSLDHCRWFSQLLEELAKKNSGTSE